MTAATTPPDPPWYELDAQEATARLNSDAADGLADEEVRARQTRFGPNALREVRARGPLSILVDQFADFMILLLLAAALLSGVIGDAKDTVVILCIVVLNALVGFAQEFRAARAMDALRQLAAPNAVVVRAGRAQTLAAHSLVPGDIVLIDAGATVPADLRLIEVADLRLDEAALTGESLPVEKITTPCADAGLSIGDRRNMAFKGTSVLYGRGRGLVVATGMETELGRIAGLMQGAGETRTPLQRHLATFGRQLSLAALALCALVFVLGVWRGEPVLPMLLTALSLAVAAIPEAMPAVVTVLLALGAARMARAQALIRRLPAVETLGSVTTICSDKTGTLTRNEMRVVDAVVQGERLPVAALDPAAEPVTTLFIALALCNDVAGGTVGDPTEVALWRAAAEAGFEKVERERVMPRVRELPFDSERKRMTTLHVGADGAIAFTKGAPEAVLPRCACMAVGVDTVPLDLAAAVSWADAMAADGRRVLAVACRRWKAPPGEMTADAIERDLTLLGLVGLLDPPRPEAAAAVATCRAAGITPVMITGDHPATARAIARGIGLLDANDGVMTGRELQALDEKGLRRRIRSVRVFARVDPAQKIRIVAALQAAGEVVAMTGDGVNDAPALARAEIGVAMGKSGTDVAREAASLVLLDDNFATIVTAVREGRRIYDNIRKFVRFVVTCNAAEIATIFLAPLFGLPVPLLPIQILWMNLVTDGLPGLALAAEPADPDVMHRRPRSPLEGLFGRGMVRHVIGGALLMAGVTLLTEAVAVRSGLAHWRTMVFTVLTLTQMWQVMAIRSERALLHEVGLGSNLPLLGAVLLTFVLQLAVIYVPVLQPIFDTAALSLGELAACLALASVVFFAIEGAKLARRAVSRRATGR
jgi:P-type Ca2+ transporter type 2C